jgi:hypothetical protein
VPGIDFGMIATELSDCFGTQRSIPPIGAQNTTDVAEDAKVRRRCHHNSVA